MILYTIDTIRQIQKADSISAQILVAASIILGHITTSQKKKYQLTTDYSNGSHEWGYWDKQIFKVLDWYEENEKGVENGTSKIK